MAFDSTALAPSVRAVGMMLYEGFTSFSSRLCNKSGAIKGVPQDSVNS